jgi:hypothetical protein
MVSLTQLWLPILLSAVGVFVASSIMHMVLKFWHTPDYHKLSNEDEVRAAIRKGNPTPGMYIIPYCRPEDMKKPEFLEKFTQGPVGFLILRPNGMFNMGKNLVQWFGFCLLVSIFAGYLAGATLAGGTVGAQVFRVVGTAAFMAYGFGSFPMAIWWGQPWRATFKDLIDGLIYGLVTAAVFASLWPK